jgi:hypothetical protein
LAYNGKGQQGLFIGDYYFQMKKKKWSVNLISRVL